MNPFRLVPQAGFTGTQALLRIPFSFGGTFNTSPSLILCPACEGVVGARLEVDGLQDFFFVGAHALNAINNPAFVAGGVNIGGILEGLLPVNTELYLRGSLQAFAVCQANSASSCGAEALFGSTLSYTGSSPDAVDIVWGLTPTLEQPTSVVPEPSSWILVGIGLLGLALRRPR